MAHPNETQRQSLDLHTRFGLRLVEDSPAKHRTEPKGGKRRSRSEIHESAAYVAQPWLGSGSLLFYPTFVKTELEEAAAATESTRLPARQSTWPWLFRAIAAGFRHYLARRRQRRAELELLELPDYLLRDIGIPRDQLLGRKPYLGEGEA